MSVSFVFMTNKVPVKIKLLHPDAKMPFYATEGAAAFDLYSVEEKVIEPGKTELVGTGISMETIDGFCWQLWGRSGLASKGIHPLGGLGDSDYRGEFKAILHNSTNVPFKIGKGERIIQIAIVPVVHAEFEVVEELSETKRGDGGFSSTGMK